MSDAIEVAVIESHACGPVGTVAPEGPPHKRRGLRCTRLNWQRPVLRSRALPTTLVRRLSVT